MNIPKISVQSRLHRTLGKVARFNTHVSQDRLDEIGLSPHLIAGEKILGVYENHETDNFFVVTDTALIQFLDGLPSRYDFDQMESSQILVTEKSVANEVQITLRNKELLIVVADGGDGKFRDVFSLGRFIARVIEDHHTKPKIQD